MSNPNRHTPFNRTLRDTRLAFSNLRHIFGSGSSVVFTWYEILAGLSILSFLTLLVFLALHFALWLSSKEPPFSVALCQLLVFPIWFFSAMESSAHFASSDHPPLACHFGRSSFRFRLLDWRHQHLIAALFYSTCLILVLLKIRSLDFHFWIVTSLCLHENLS